MWGTGALVTEQQRGRQGLEHHRSFGRGCRGGLLTREEEEHVFHKTARSLFPNSESKVDKTFCPSWPNN